MSYSLLPLSYIFCNIFIDKYNKVLSTVYISTIDISYSRQLDVGRHFNNKRTIEVKYTDYPGAPYEVL